MPKRSLAVSKDKETEGEVKKQKVLVEDQRPCPHCGQMITVRWTRVTKLEPVKGEYEQNLVLEKSMEESLDKHIEE